MVNEDNDYIWIGPKKKGYFGSDDGWMALFFWMDEK